MDCVGLFFSSYDSFSIKLAPIFSTMIFPIALFYFEMYFYISVLSIFCNCY